MHRFVPPIILSELGYVYGVSGRKDSAREMIRQMDTLRAKEYVDPFLVPHLELSLLDLLD